MPLLLLVLLLAVPAHAAPLMVSGPIEGLESCSGRDQVRGFEAEPHLAASPDGRVLVGTWQQDRANTRGAIVNAVAVSSDGGATWTRSLLPGVSRCSGGTADNASDPWAQVASDGTIYVASLEADWGGEAGFEGTMVVHRSFDLGETWDRLVANPRTPGNDKETLTVDPANPARAWMVWTRGSGGPLISRTDDHGTTWTDEATIPAAPRAYGGAADQHILPVGGDRVIAAWTDSSFRGSTELVVRVSNDLGETWGRARILSLFDSFGPYRYGSTPFRGDGVIFSSATGPKGAAYIAVNEANAQIVVYRSLDRGAKWRRLVVARSDAPVFIPAVAAAPNGRDVAVSYATLAPDRKGDGRVTTRYRIALSGNRGKTWRDRPLTPKFDARRLRTERGYFLGDYTGLAPLGDGGFGALVTAARPLARFGPSDVFFVER